jgi:hypothetical protein
MTDEEMEGIMYSWNWYWLQLEMESDYEEDAMLSLLKVSVICSRAMFQAITCWFLNAGSWVQFQLFLYSVYGE